MSDRDLDFNILVGVGSLELSGEDDLTVVLYPEGLVDPGSNHVNSEAESNTLVSAAGNAQNSGDLASTREDTKRVGRTSNLKSSDNTPVVDGRRVTSSQFNNVGIISLLSGVE